MPINLTANAISAINGGDLNSKPLVQVVDIKLIGSKQERYRLLLSDSVSTQQAMLAMQLNDRVKSGSVRKGSVVQLIDYICSTVQNRKIIVVLNMETIIQDCDIIGKPDMLGEYDTASEKQGPATTSSSTPQINKTTIDAPSSGRASFSNGKLATSRDSIPDNGVQTFRPTIQPAYQPPPDYRNHGAVMRNEAAARIIPIAALNPYQGRWAIKARVTSKGGVRHYNNARGDGKVFSFDLLDSDGGEIRATCFNTVVDHFYHIIEVGKVFVISKGTLRPAQKNFNHLKNEWEIMLEVTSSVDPCQDEDASIPRQQFTFKAIREIENTENNSIVDVIGVVVTVNPSVPIVRKNGLETQKRTLILKDQSGSSVELTLWGEFCNREGKELQEIVETGSVPVLAVKAGRVNDFSGKTIGTLSSSQLFINPEFPEANGLRDWFERGGKDLPSHSISREAMPGAINNDLRKSLSQIKDEGLGRSDKADWITVKGTISFVKTDNFCYTACPLMNGDRQCNKKVAKSGNSKWLCDRCNQEFDECDYRYLLQVQVQDHTGLTWVTAFQETGEAIIGCSAKELYNLRYEEEDEERFSETIRKCLFNEFFMKLKVKEELYGDEQRVKVTVVKVDKVNYPAESRYLLDMISKFRGN